jgi:hypothetical protein
MARCRDCRRDFAAAHRLIRQHRLQRQAVRILPVAVAATLLVMVARARPDTPGDTVRAQTEGSDVPSIRAEKPASDAIVNVDAVIFVWRSVGGRPLYRLNLTDRDGNSVWSAETSDTSLTLPRSVTLVSGRNYFWSVDALSADGRSLTTRTLRFSTRSPP